MKKIEKIENFVKRFIDLEKEIEVKFRKEDFESYTNLVDEILTYGTDDLILVSKMTLPLSRIIQMGLELNRNQPVTKRDLFKISEYENSKYDKVWAAYVSIPNPGEGITKLIDSCFLIAEINNSFKFIVKYNLDEDSKLWSFRGGDKDLYDYYSLGESISVKRILSPNNDEWSIEEYNKNS